ncbi:hypothetical protein ACFV16_35205 [Streptomyces massasporeus]|uniref:hypothetical protein n=1 Tax=Streptomyces massasporeus TaxID=67324 RepID=UPI003679441A
MGQGRHGEALAPPGRVVDRADHTAAQSLDRELNARANTVTAAVLGGFAAVAAGNGSFAAAILVVGTAAATLPARAALRGETLER